jgi:hypothetical protein
MADNFNCLIASLLRCTFDNIDVFHLYCICTSFNKKVLHALMSACFSYSFNRFSKRIMPHFESASASAGWMMTWWQPKLCSLKKSSDSQRTPV